jgi:hypothetical protein
MAPTPHTSLYQTVTGSGDDKQYSICSFPTDQENSTIRLLRVTTNQFGVADHQIQLIEASIFLRMGSIAPLP